MNKVKPSIIMSSSLVPNQSFSIKHPILINPFNRAPASTVTRVIQSNLGTTSAAVPASIIPGGYIFVSPTGSTGSTYTLPTAATLLSEFGETLGQPSLAAGEVLVLRVVNKGTQPAIFVGSTGTDGTSVTALSPVTGTGRTTWLNIEFTSISAGGVSGNNNVGIIFGGTGSYTLYQ